MRRPQWRLERSAGIRVLAEEPRYVDPARAREIVATLSPNVTPIGVFVDQPPTSEPVAKEVGLRRRATAWP